MKLDYKAGKMILNLDSLEADVIINILKFVALDATFDENEYVLRFGAERTEVKNIHDDLRTQLKK